MTSSSWDAHDRSPRRPAHTNYVVSEREAAALRQFVEHMDWEVRHGIGVYSFVKERVRAELRKLRESGALRAIGGK